MLRGALMRRVCALGTVLLATAAVTGSAQAVTPTFCEGVAVRTAQEIVDALADSTLPDVNLCVDDDVDGYALVTSMLADRRTLLIERLTTRMSFALIDT